MIQYKSRIQSFPNFQKENIMRKSRKFIHPISLLIVLILLIPLGGTAAGNSKAGQINSFGAIQETVQ
jgi:hypothetical protein